MIEKDTMPTNSIDVEPVSLSHPASNLSNLEEKKTMEFSTQLFESEHLYLEAYDLDKDAAIEAGFTRDLDYAWSIDPDGIPHPLNTFQVKKMREEMLKRSAENGNCYIFSIRSKEEDRFLGTIVYPWIFWKNQTASFKLNLGNESDDELYYGEALHIALRYSFEELGLYRSFTWLGSHDEIHLARLLKAGMEINVRQRQMYYRHGRLWDKYELGMSRDNWVRNQFGE
jgi:RimJ/RimL family protein N-acetyltransferase